MAVRRRRDRCSARSPTPTQRAHGIHSRDLRDDGVRPRARSAWRRRTHGWTSTTGGSGCSSAGSGCRADGERLRDAQPGDRQAARPARAGHRGGRGRAVRRRAPRCRAGGRSAGTCAPATSTPSPGRSRSTAGSSPCSRSLDNGKPIRETRDIDIPLVARHFYYHAGWAQLMEHELPGYEPLGVVGQIIPGTSRC